MTYRTGTITSGNQTDSISYINQVDTDLLSNGWSKVGTNVVSGSITWNVYESLGTLNSIGTTFYMALGYTTTSTPGDIIITIFKEWDAVNNLARGIPPNRFDGGLYSIPSIDTTFPWGWQPLFAGSGDAKISNVAITTNGVYVGTGTNGTTPPQFNSTSFTGTVNGVISNPTGIRSATIVNGGTGYTTAPTITFSGGGATSQATATCTVAGGVINSVTIVDRGSGYTSQPTITITPTSGGSGAVLEIRSANWVPIPTISNAGSRLTDHLLFKNITASSGTVTTADSVQVILDPGWAIRRVVLGSSSTDYLYSVTIDRFIHTLRGNGSSFLDSYYYGAYDRVLASNIDSIPVCACYIGSLDINLNKYTAHFQSQTGFTLSEINLGSLPYVWSSDNAGSSSAPYSCRLPAFYAQNGSATITWGTIGVNEIYTNKRIAMRAILMGRGAPGAISGPRVFVRGILKGVLVCETGSATLWADEIQWSSGSTNFAAVRASNGDGIYFSKE